MFQAQVLRLQRILFLTGEMYVCQRITGEKMKQIAMASRPEVFCLRFTAKESKRETYVVNSTTFKPKTRVTFSEKLERKQSIKL
jgi:hypothetical protein